MSEAAAWPLEIRVKQAEQCLEIDFDNGKTYTYPAELLRVESPSAEVQGHTPSQKVTVPGKRRVGIVRLEPVGNYAVRIVFDDGHSTGIFSWSYLLKLGAEQRSLWANYIASLETQGLSRDS